MFTCQVLTHRNFFSVLSRLRSTISIDPTLNISKSESKNESHPKPWDWDNAKPYRDIPGPKPLPLIGNVWRFIPFVGQYYGLDQYEQHERFVKEYGDIMKLTDMKLTYDILILFDPDDIEKVYRTEGIWPFREVLESLHYYKMQVRDDLFHGRGGLISEQNEEWHETRTLISPTMMHPTKVRAYTPAMDSVTNDFMHRVRFLSEKHPYGDMPDNFMSELNRWSLESICVFGLNRRLGLLNYENPNPEALQFIKDVLNMFELFEHFETKPSLWRHINTPRWIRFVKTVDRISDFIKESVDDVTAKLEKKDIKNENLSILEEILLKDKKIAFATAYDFFMAGVDTTSRSTAGVLYFIAANPRVQRRLREEIKTYLPNKDTPMTERSFANIPYMEAVIKEALRLAPITTGNVRSTTRDIVLKGYQIPKGTRVIGSHMYLSRQEKYFPRPFEFIPERWLRNENKEFISPEHHHFAYMPFGFGPRSCIGRRLAKLEIEVLLSRLIRNFELSWPHEKMTWSMGLLHGVGSPLKLRVKALKE